MSSCFLILDEVYEPLLKRVLRPLVNVDDAIDELQGVLKGSQRPIKPIFECMGWHYVTVCRDELHFVIILQKNNRVSPVSVLHYLDQMYQLIRGFIGSRLNKTNIRDNFHLIFELLDESSDFGIIQVTNYSIIHDFIKVQVIKSDSDTTEVAEEDKNDPKDQDETFINSHILRTLTSAVSWRPKGINYGKNEFFLDVIEKLEFVRDLESGLVRSNVIHGAIVCKCFLSGMPYLSIGLNKLTQKNVHFMKRLKFHECVDLDSLMSEESPAVKFIPPDGEFELCTYSLSRSLHDEPVIKLTSFQLSRKDIKDSNIQDKLILHLSITTNFKSQDSAKDITIALPMKAIFEKWNIDLETLPLFKSDVGDVMFNMSKGSIEWRIPNLKGGHGEKHYTLKCMFEIWDKDLHQKRREEVLNSMDPPPLRTGPKLEKIWQQLHGDKSGTESNYCRDEKEQSILATISFEIPYYAVSGLRVEYLKIEEHNFNYQSFPWVRYKTTNDKEYMYQLSI